VVPIAFLILMSAACAKKPEGPGSAAPAPSGAAGTAPATEGAGTGMAGAGAGAGAAGAGAGAEAARLAGTAPVAPAVQRPVTQEFKAVVDLRDIYFDFDKYAIRATDAPVLDANAKWLKANDGYALLIEGHADERGTDEYNVALGERRAKATLNYLLSQGVRANRMNIVSYGEERPVCHARTEACWAQNRRAHFLVKQQ
jgi:peptidoglycan-associated lipoprotein